MENLSKTRKIWGVKGGIKICFLIGLLKNRREIRKLSSFIFGVFYF